MRGFLIATFFWFTFSVVAQIPGGFKYQTVVRDSSMNVLPNTDVTFRFSILSDDTLRYCELHSAHTSANGMVNLVIGQGIPEYAAFDQIQWLNNSHFLKTEIAVSNQPFEEIGSDQLLSVPYAMAARQAAIPDEDWTVSGPDQYSAPQGNVGIGVMAPSEKLEVEGNVKLSDTLKFRGYVNTSQNISNPGQILIGEHDILMGYKSDNFGNILIGNSLYGKTVFDLDMTGNGNIGIGTDIFHETTTGYSNLCIGMYTGYNLSTGSNNIFLGSSAGEHISTGNINVCIGNQAGNGRQGNSNVFIGDRAGYAWAGSGSENVMIGKFAGYNYNSSNSSSVFLGKYAGYGNQSSETVCIGPYAGRSATGDRSIFIGYEAGKNWTGGDMLIIDNHNDNASPFIKGDMANDLLEVNASLTVHGDVQQESVNIQSTLNLQELTEFPAGPSEGDMIYLNDTLRFYNGTAWRNIW